jgi:NAD(P)-dependent dehydrogenase (short-subunit alcohol dehydrogenase family)
VTEERTALVTGAGRSVGQGIALALASAGARVAVNDLHEDRAADTVRLIEEAGGKAASFIFDVSDRSAVRDAVAQVQKQLGPVSILVNNAGIPEGAQHGPFAESDPDSWSAWININLYGSLYCVHAVLAGMCERSWGRIIQISAGSASTGRAIGVSLYAGSKAGVEGVLRHVSHEVATQGVTVNTLALGLMENVGPVEQMDERTRERVFSLVPIRRLGLPREVGAAATWLCSEDGGFITGQTIHVNGGSYNGR